MNQQNPVPRLDLAPKLKRPLSLWNPLDYLRLLYWVFYFPQALRWYVDTFGGGYIPEEEMNWRKGWEILRENPIQRQLLLQGLVLTVVVPLVVCGMLQEIGVHINWSRVALGVALGVASGVAILRPETWFITSPLNLLYRQQRWLLSRVTPLPLPYLAPLLQNWLQQDWETSLHNINQLLAYTLQFIPVVAAVNQVLAKTPDEQIIWRVSRLAEAPFDWQIVRFASASLNKRLNSKFVESLFVFVPDSWKQRLLPRSITNTTLRIDTPARATAAGFWHLHDKEPTLAMLAFDVVRHLLYGEEMFTLAQTLDAFDNTKELADIANLQAPTFPTKLLLRPTTWQALTSLHQVIKDVKIVQRSASRFKRSSTLNRALGELQSILNNAKTLPQAERDLILDIAQTWQTALLKIAGEVGEVAITKPVINPYIIGDPVEGNLFVGREDVMRQLAELWVRDYHLQSVVIYGHRRMGKTSILLNAAQCLGCGLERGDPPQPPLTRGENQVKVPLIKGDLGGSPSNKEGIKVAYINFLNIGDNPQGVGEVLMAICDAISEEVNLPPPADADLLNLPYPTFRRYLKQVAASLKGGLIIALDEFEKIEELIKAEKIPPDFMGYLRGQVQMSSKIAFALAGLHTLEEMTADYFHPFFSGVIHIPVGFMKLGATRQILANPDQEFLLDYIPEVLDKIHTLTAGQPYLVQLVGFLLVRHYNDTVFEQGRPRNPVFTIDDLDAVINNPELFQKGSGYFGGVWGQAARGAQGQQMILKILAPHPEGLSLDELKRQISQFVGANSPWLPPQLDEVLETLKRHDVIAEKDGRWQIIVELFRRWVVQLTD